MPHPERLADDFGSSCHSGKFGEITSRPRETGGGLSSKVSKDLQNPDRLLSLNFDWLIPETAPESNALDGRETATPEAKPIIAVPAVIQTCRDFMGLEK